MRIQVEGPELTSVGFQQILDIFKEKISQLYSLLILKTVQCQHFLENSGEGGLKSQGDTASL